MTTTERKQRTITLTESRPVSIYEDEWPTVAGSGWEDCDSEYEFQANRKAAATLRVRKHEDGRVIVYGTYRYNTSFQGERDVYAAAGYVLDDGPDDSNIIAAVQDTIERLSSYDSLPEGWQPDWRMLADDCIADLPAENL